MTLLTPLVEFNNPLFRYDLILENGTVMMPQGLVFTDVGVLNGKIVSFGTLKNATATQRINAKGLHILPGLIS